MRVSVLGPVEVREDDRVVAVAGSRVRRLLVRLAVDAPDSVPIGELVDAVWYDDDAPAQVANALQSLVSRLRRSLGSPEVVQQTPSGYRLAGCEIDVDIFASLTAAGREYLAAGDAESAGALLRKALHLWTGPPLVDAGDAEYATGLAARLAEQRIEALCDRIDADLAMGTAPELVAELEELTRSMPRRERLVGQQMVALARAGRGAEALAVFARVRESLAEDLGADPSQAL